MAAAVSATPVTWQEVAALEPSSVFSYFAQMTQIPRPSKQESRCESCEQGACTGGAGAAAGSASLTPVRRGP